MEKLVIFIAFFDNLSQQPIISPLAAAFGASPLLIGLIVGTYSLGSILGNVYSLYICRKLGLRTTIYLSFMLVSVVLVSYALIQTSEQLLIVRILHGAAAGIGVPCIFSLVSQARQQGRKMSEVGQIIGLAAITGPPLAGVVSSRWGSSTVFVGLALLFAFGALLIPTLPQQNPPKKPEINIKAVLIDNGLHIAYASAFSLMFSTGMLGFWFPLQLLALGYPLSSTGMLFGLFGVTAICVMGIARTYGIKTPVHYVCLGFVSICLGLSVFTISSNLWYMGVAMILYGFGFGLVFPAMNIVLINSTSITNRTSAYAIFHSFFSLAVFLAPLLGGMIYTRFNPLLLVLFVIGMSFLVFLKIGLSRRVLDIISKERGDPVS